MLLSSRKVGSDTNMKADKEIVSHGLREAITLLCKTGLPFHKEISVEGLLGITVDHNEVFLVSIKDNIVKTLTDEDNGLSVLDQQYRDSGSVVNSRESTPERPVSRGSKTLDIIAKLSSQQYHHNVQNVRQRKSKPSKAPRKSSTPTQILPAHTQSDRSKDSNSPSHSPVAPPGGGGGPPEISPTFTATIPYDVNETNKAIRAVNMNRHILKVPTTPITHHRQEVAAKPPVSEDKPVDLHKPRPDTSRTDDAPQASEPGATDTAAMKCAYSNSGSSYASPQSEPDFSPLTIDLEPSKKACETNGLSEIKETGHKKGYVMIAPMTSQAQDEPMALTCSRSQSSANNSRTSSPAPVSSMWNNPTAIVAGATLDLSGTIVSEGPSPLVVIKGEPMDPEDSQSQSEYQNPSEYTPPKASSDPHATIQSLLNSGLGLPVPYMPTAIPYALDFSGAARSPVKGSEATLLHVRTL